MTGRMMTPEQPPDEKTGMRLIRISRGTLRSRNTPLTTVRVDLPRWLIGRFIGMSRKVTFERLDARWYWADGPRRPVRASLAMRLELYELWAQTSGIASWGLI